MFCMLYGWRAHTISVNDFFLSSFFFRTMVDFWGQCRGVEYLWGAYDTRLVTCIIIYATRVLGRVHRVDDAGVDCCNFVM